MKKYKWDLYEIRNRLNILEKMYQNEQDDDIKETISTSIQIYKDMVDLINNNKQENELLNDTLKYNSLDDLINTQIEYYNDNDMKILDMILQSYIPFRDTYTLTPVINNIPVAITNNELIDIAKDFSKKMLPNDVKKDFNKALKDYNYINFSYSKQNDNYAGTTIFEPIFNQKYIYISRTNTLLDIITLPHEIFHYIFNDCDVGITIDYNMHYTTEIEGSFANILFSDYYYNNSCEDKNYFNNYFLESYHSYISEIVVRNSFLNSIKDNKKFRMNKFNKELSFWGIIPFEDEKEISEYLVSPLDVNMKYTLGYLAGIDLYYIYQNDPELAFYLLKNIRFIKRENDIINLFRKNHLTFMDDGYENLKKYIKKIERQN